jgi:hypothetical protein
MPRGPGSLAVISKISMTPQGCEETITLGCHSRENAIAFTIKVCAKVCADQNGRLHVARKLLNLLVPASRFELLTPRV